MNKILAVILAVALFFVLGSYAVPSYPELAAQVANPFSAIETHEGYARDALEEPMQQLYDIIKTGLLAEETEIVVRRTGYDKDDIKDVLWCIKQDAPEMFWVNWLAWEYSQGADGMTIRPSYIVTGADREERARLLEETCTAILEQAATADISSDYDKVAFVHDYLIDSVDYLEEGSLDIHTAYGALVDKQAVCDGYAHALQLLLSKMDVECFYIEGSTTISPPNIGHAWNMVNVDGAYYLVDATWDDVDKTAEEAWSGTHVLSYRFFLLSTEEMALTHTATIPIELPHCERYGFYERIGLSSPTAMLDAIRPNIINIAVTRARAGRYYVEFEVTDPDGFNYLREHKDTELAEIVNGVNEALEDADMDLRFRNVLMSGDATLEGYIITLFFNPEE